MSYAFCGCLNCSRFNFQSCMMSGLGGMGTKLQRKYVKGMGDRAALAEQDARRVCALACQRAAARRGR